MLKIGILFTVIWMFIISILVFLKWDDFLTLSLNESGDFLAGITAPLAFLWLVIGYFQQGKELKMNTEALLQQRKELSRQASELQKQNEYLEISATAAKQQARYTRRR